MTDREILFALIASLSLCESGDDVAQAVRKTFELMGVEEVEFDDLVDLNRKMDAMGFLGLWNEGVVD